MEFTRDDKWTLSPLVDEKDRHYGEAEDGLVDFGDVAAHLLGQQTQYASRYVDGLLPGYPNLGNGLRINGDTGNYHSLSIHPEDIEEFILRVHAYRAYKHEYVTDDEGALYRLEPEDVEQLREYLENAGAFDTKWSEREIFGI